MYAIHTTEAPRGFRPIRVWGSLARQHRASIRPAEVVHILRSSFLAVARFGSVVPASSLWMNHEGIVEIVSPDQDGGFTSPAWCMEGLGLMACELLSGAPMPDTISPQVALHLAKAGSELAPGGWDPALGFVLQRMLGVVAPYQSVHEALKELNEFYLAAPRPVLASSYGGVVEGESLPPTFSAPSHSWALPALMGGVAASLLFLVGGGAFWLGTKSVQPPLPAPVVAQAPPAPAPTVLTLDPAILEALKKLVQAPVRAPEPRERPRERAVERPVAQPVVAARVIVPEDDEPVYVGAVSRRGQSPSEGVGRVKTGDFIARR